MPSTSPLLPPNECPSSTQTLLLTIVGARPQFIKAAAVSRAIGRHNASYIRDAFHFSRGSRSAASEGTTESCHQPGSAPFVAVH